MILMAYGEAKAEAIKGMIDGPVTTDMPASALQNHQDVVVIIDDAAASKLYQLMKNLKHKDFLMFQVLCYTGSNRRRGEKDVTANNSRWRNWF